jgi:crotonobetainyl-CoA:carnitine CoA-transferase CaiB-like acyl-CoA transferase
VSASVAASSSSFAQAKPPLDGVRVLDLTHVIAGPYCSQMLGDMGADIVKIERPGSGDELRGVGRYAGRERHEDYFNASNRRKRSVIANLKEPAGVELVRALAREADVLIQNFAPSTAAHLGIDADAIRSINPAIVYCAISGFGQTGPLRDRPALDPIIQAMSGVMSVTGDPQGPPMQVGAPIGDVVAGMFAPYSIVAALYARRESGAGASIDVSMIESMIAVLAPRMGETLQGGVSPQRMGNQNPMRVPAGMFKAGDGNYITFIVQGQPYWAPFCRALGRAEWLEDPRFTSMGLRVRHRAEITALVEERLMERPAAEWLERLYAEKVPAGPVYDYARALSDRHITERGLVITAIHPTAGRTRLVGPPWKHSYPEPYLRPAPLLGEHTAEVLEEWLGWGEDSIADYLGGLPTTAPRMGDRSRGRSRSGTPTRSVNRRPRLSRAAGLALPDGGSGVARRSPSRTRAEQERR